MTALLSTAPSVTGDDPVLVTKSPYSSTHDLYRVLTRAEGGTVDLVCKQLPLNAAAMPAAVGVRMPARETWAYDALLPHAPDGPPRLHGWTTRGDYAYLYLEHVEGLQLRHVGDFDAWRGTARWLGRFHGRLAKVMAREPLPLTCIDPTDTTQLQQRCRAVTGRWSARDRSLLSQLLEGYRRRAQQVDWDSPTVLHGDFFASNVVISDGPRGIRICAVDWEGVGIGPGSLDLAALVAGSWSGSQRSSLIAAYGAGLVAEGRNVDLAQLEDSVRVAGVRLCLQTISLGDYGAPADHVRDWLADGRRLLEETT